MAKSFGERLKRCAEIGDLTISDLARWFDRPRATVNTWVLGRTPYGPSGRRAEHDLQLLEARIKARDGFPVPSTLLMKKRIIYIRGQRNDAERNTRVPNLRTAG